MFTLNDLYNQVDCQGKVRVMMIEERSGDLKLVYKDDNGLGKCPFEFGEKELVYIWSDRDTTVFEVNE